MARQRGGNFWYLMNQPSGALEPGHRVPQFDDDDFWSTHDDPYEAVGPLHDEQLRYNRGRIQEYIQAQGLHGPENAKTRRTLYDEAHAHANKAKTEAIAKAMRLERQRGGPRKPGFFAHPELNELAELTHEQRYIKGNERFNPFSS